MSFFRDDRLPGPDHHIKWAQGQLALRPAVCVFQSLAEPEAKLLQFAPRIKEMKFYVSVRCGSPCFQLDGLKFQGNRSSMRVCG